MDPSHILKLCGQTVLHGHDPYSIGLEECRAAVQWINTFVNLPSFADIYSHHQDYEEIIIMIGDYDTYIVLVGLKFSDIGVL